MSVKRVAVIGLGAMGALCAQTRTTRPSFPTSCTPHILHARILHAATKGPQRCT
ncbi:hypothetical protein ABZ250_09815 [Streptomyces afghaniensis]|uniref:hypothetical protein n=1 Tax=Streptomyces afghaniensis TaxID=66865 RepID=UPI0033B88E32